MKTLAVPIGRRWRRNRQSRNCSRPRRR